MTTANRRVHYRIMNNNQLAIARNLKIHLQKVGGGIDRVLERGNSVFRPSGPRPTVSVNLY